jgi:hypothetical protein
MVRWTWHKHKTKELYLLSHPILNNVTIIVTLFIIQYRYSILLLNLEYFSILILAKIYILSHIKIKIPVKRFETKIGKTSTGLYVSAFYPQKPDYEDLYITHKRIRVL